MNNANIKLKMCHVKVTHIDETFFAYIFSVLTNNFSKY